MTFKHINDDKARTSTADFTNLALLLRLLCFLNSKTTSPTVTGTLSKGPGVAKDNANISTLEGVATILVQDHEIIATTYSAMSTVLAASSCEDSELSVDAGADVGVDTGAGAGVDAGVDAGAGAGAGVDAGAGAGTDLDIQAAHPLTTEAGKGQFNMNFATVPNPDEKTNTQNASSRHANPHNLRVLEDGSDLSGAIKKYEWAYALT